MRIATDKLDIIHKFDQIAKLRKRKGVTKKIDLLREKILADTLSELQPKIALDLACGNGRYFKVFCKEGLRYAGLDISLVSLKIAKKFHDVVIQGDAENLPFKRNTFDFVSFINALLHFKDPLLPISEIHRVLHPKGYCIIEVLNKNSIGCTIYSAIAFFCSVCYHEEVI